MLVKIAVALALFIAVINAPLPNPLQDSPATSLAGTPIAPVYSAHEIPPQVTPMPPAPPGYHLKCLTIEYRPLDNGGIWGVCTEYGYEPDIFTSPDGYP